MLILALNYIIFYFAVTIAVTCSSTVRNHRYGISVDQRKYDVWVFMSHFR
jgi:hypothetical protein